MEDTIRLVCPVCKFSNEISRMDSDPPKAVEIWMAHDSCANDNWGKGHASFHDEDGNELDGLFISKANVIQ